MSKFIVTVTKTREDTFVVEAALEDHARFLALRGEGELIDTHHWVDVVDDVRPAPREEAKP